MSALNVESWIRWWRRADAVDMLCSLTAAHLRLNRFLSILPARHGSSATPESGTSWHFRNTMWRREECEEAVKLLRAALPASAHYAMSPRPILKRMGLVFLRTVRRRSRHVVSENERTLAAAVALPRGDFVEMGRLMY